MAQPGKVRVSAFASIVGDSVEAIRTAKARDYSPIEWSNDKGQRYYDAEDVLDWLLFKGLATEGMEKRFAAEMVKLSGASGTFLRAHEKGRDVREFTLFCYLEARTDEVYGPHYHRGSSMMRASAISDWLKHNIDRAGETRRSERYGMEKFVGISRIWVLPIEYYWRMAKEYAEAAGYRIAGTAILPLATDEGDD